MQSKLGTIGSSVQPSELQPGLRTVFSTLYSQPVQPSKLRIIPFQPVLNSFLHLFSLCSLLSTCNHCSRTNYHESCWNYISNPVKTINIITYLKHENTYSVYPYEAIYIKDLTFLFRQNVK